MNKPTAALLAAALVATALAAPALAHPHVWVTTKGEVVYGADGRIAGIRHAWTFDAAYSAYSTQGLDKNGDGKVASDELNELAKVNIESLNEYGYFTVAKANGAKVEFIDPTDFNLDLVDGALVLRFLLPLKEPARADKAFLLDVFDPTYFVSFSVADGADAMRLVDAPKGCVLTVNRPKPVQPAQQQKLSEAFFSALDASSGFGAQFANKVIVACP